MLHVALDGFDEVRNKVMPPCKLYVYLSETVAYPVAFVDQTVVDAYDPKDYCRYDPKEY